MVTTVPRTAIGVCADAGMNKSTGRMRHAQKEERYRFMTSPRVEGIWGPARPARALGGGQVCAPRRAGDAARKPEPGVLRHARQTPGGASRRVSVVQLHSHVTGTVDGAEGKRRRPLARIDAASRIEEG